MKPPATTFDETIIAQATAPGAGFRGILRLSGPNSVQSLCNLFEPAFDAATKSRIVNGSLFPWNRQRPVPVTIFYWPKGHGYTGDESLEIHTVGSPPILDAMTAAICRNGNVRLAKPGEFTMRAFLSGRIDLTQAEAVLGVIEATNGTSLDSALDQLAGGLAKPLRNLRSELLDMLVRLEAGFDFADEDIEFVSAAEIRRLLEAASEHTESIRHKMTGRCLNGTKPRIVLLGLPNAGKTTLFNKLLGSERGIVSPTPGTTRDYLEADWIVDGIPCALVDTAGLDREPCNDIDAAAQESSSTLAANADLILFCIENGTEASEAERRLIEGSSPRTLLVRTKGATTTEDIRNEIASRIRDSFLSSEVVPSTAVRCRESLDHASQALEDAKNLIDAAVDEALVAAEIRVTLNALGEVVGEVHTDDLLDGIFSRFCIGK